ncbi:hypothetical protein, partial [Frankia sp. Cr1]|uniref:hypothetical protein n=1 Tax=Frankia sp. Cr1 TaxID=3073931 RepID=UPI002AD588FF
RSRGRRRDGHGVDVQLQLQLHLSQIDEAEELLTNDPLGLLIGMVPDQPVSERWSRTGQSALV